MLRSGDGIACSHNHCDQKQVASLLYICIIHNTANYIRAPAPCWLISSQCWLADRPSEEEEKGEDSSGGASERASNKAASHHQCIS